MEKLQSVDENDFYGIVSSEAELSSEELSYQGKSKRGANYEIDRQKREGNLFSRRNKVAPLLYVREEAWTKRRQIKATTDIEGENSYSSLMMKKEDGKVARKLFFQQRNTKTGKEARNQEKHSQLSSSSNNYLASFLNDLTPPSAANFVTCQSNELPCDLFFIEEEADDTPPSSDGAISHVVLDLRSRGEAWAVEVKLNDNKSTLNKFFSRFKRVKTTKVKKIRL